MNKTIEDPEAWKRGLFTHILKIIQPPLDPEGVRPPPRSRVEAYGRLKEEKLKEIHEFHKNYKGSMYSPVERCLWGPMCQNWECPMGLEAFNHEAGEDCLLDPKEAWKLPPATIILRPPGRPGIHGCRGRPGRGQREKPGLVSSIV